MKDEFKLIYEFRTYSSRAEANRSMKASFVDKSGVRKWFLKFRNSDLMIDDQSKCAWLKEIDRTAAVKDFDDEPNMTTRMLRDNVVRSHSEVENY